MIRVLFFWVTFFSLSFSLEVHEPLFPKGETLKKVIVNDGLKGKALFLNNKNTFVTLEGTYDIKINFFNIKIGKKFFQIKAKISRITDVSIAKDKPYLIYVEQADERAISLNIFDINSKRIIHTLELKERIDSICISNNAKYIVYATKNHKIYIYDREEDKLLSIFSTKETVKNIKLDALNKYIFILEKKSLVMYDFTTFKKIHLFHTEKNISLTKFNVSNDGKYVLFVFNINNLKVWKIKSKKLILDLKIRYIEDAQFTNDSKKIIYGEKGSLKSLDIVTQKNMFIARDKNLKRIYNISVGNDAQVLLNDRFLINIKTSNIINLAKKFGDGVEHYIEESFYIKRLNTIFSRDKEKGIKVWNLQKNSLECIINKESEVNDMTLSRDKKYLIFSTDKTLKVWDIEEKEIIKEFSEENHTIQNIAISNSGEKIVFKVDKRLKILDFKLWKVITEIKDESLIYKLIFLKKKYLIVNAFQEIKVFNIETKKLVNHIDNENNTWLEVYRDSPYYRVYFYLKLKSEIKDILTNEIVATFSKNNYVYTIFNKNAYIGDLENEKLDVWDLKQEKILNEKKKQYYETKNIDNSIALIDVNWSDMFDGEKIEKEIFYDDDSWAIVDYQTKKLYRYGNKAFLLDAKTFKPILPKNMTFSKEDIEIFFDKKDIRLTNNSFSIFNIQVKNISNHKLYWINPVIDDENFTIETNNIVLLEPNEIKNISVSMAYNEFIEQSFSKDLTLKIIMGEELVKERKINIEIEKKVDIDVESIKLDNVGMIAVKINKFIDKNLTNIKVILSEGNKSIENTLYSLETNESITVYLRNDETFVYTWWGDGHDFMIMVDSDEIKSYVFKKHINFDMPLNIYILLILLFFTPMTIVFLWYMGSFNRNIQKIINNPNTIFDMPLDKLSYYKKLLKRRMEKDYYENNFSYILGEEADRVSKFFKINNKERAKIFVDKSNAKFKQLKNNFFEVTLSKNFELPLDTLRL